MATNKIQVPLPANATIRVNGITNSGGWSQQIIFETPDKKVYTWQGTGNQNNKIIGQMEIGPYTTGGQVLNVAMNYDSGKGFQPSQVKVDSFNMDGLSGYIVGGQDGGGRPSGDAYWNTILFVYWAEGY